MQHLQLKTCVKVLAPFNGIVNALLNGGKLEIAGIVSIEGENGYINAIKPLLEVLGTAIQFLLMQWMAVLPIEGLLKVVFARVEVKFLIQQILLPISLNLVPEIANFIAKGRSPEVR